MLCRRDTERYWAINIGSDLTGKNNTLATENAGDILVTEKDKENVAMKVRFIVVAKSPQSVFPVAISVTVSATGKSFTSETATSGHWWSLEFTTVVSVSELDPV